MNPKQLQQRLVTGMFNPPQYYQKVKNLFGSSLIGYWPLWETSGIIASDQSGNTRNGSYSNTAGTLSGVTLSQTGTGDGKTSAAFDGTNGFVNIYSSGFASAFNPAEGTIAAWVKVTPFSEYADGVQHYVINLRTDSNNRVYLSVGPTNYGVVGVHVAGGVTRSIGMSPIYNTDWIHIAYTWSVANNQTAFYFNGVLVATPSAGPGTWTGALASANSVLAALATTLTNRLAGNMAHAVVLNRPATATEINQMWLPHAGGGAVFFGDSVTEGTGASDAAHRYVNLICANKSWTNFTNSGIGSTVLQNTPYGGNPGVNNGQDTYTRRISLYAPDYAFILYGINDIRQYMGGFAPDFTAGKYQAGLAQIVSGVISHGTPKQQVIIGSVPHFILSDDETQHAAYDAACLVVANLYGTKFIDVHAWMHANGGNALIDADQIHPNDSGHAAIANAFLSVM